MIIPQKNKRNVKSQHSNYQKISQVNNTSQYQNSKTHNHAP